MKKLIAILATAIAASGLTAFGQDWITFATSGTTIWDNSGGTPSFDAAAAGKMDAILLWAPTSATDNLPSIGTAFGLRGTGTALDQVGTNAVAWGAVNPIGSISNLLSSGWSVATDMGSSAYAVATTGTGTLKGQATYNAGSPFQCLGITGASGSSVEEIIVAYNASASSWATASAIGYSNPFANTVGTASTDPNSTASEASANQFGVVSVPEPTTLALAGLGGLSMLALRRRKA